MFQPCLVFLTTENNSNELLLLDFLYNLPFWKNLSTPFIYTHECLSIVSVVCLAILQGVPRQNDIFKIARKGTKTN